MRSTSAYSGAGSPVSGMIQSAGQKPLALLNLALISMRASRKDFFPLPATPPVTKGVGSCSPPAFPSSTSWPFSIKARSSLRDIMSFQSLGPCGIRVQELKSMSGPSKFSSQTSFHPSSSGALQAPARREIANKYRNAFIIDCLKHTNIRKVICIFQESCHR